MTNQKTYAEIKGHQPFDWNKFIDRAIAGQISIDEHKGARNLARHWVTCACGNLCADIPRDTMGAPIDTDLSYLGTQFFARVSQSRFNAAKVTLSLIETRSAELIAQIEKEASHE